jgi:hypothetical protein
MPLHYTLASEPPASRRLRRCAPLFLLLGILGGALLPGLIAGDRPFQTSLCDDLDQAPAACVPLKCTLWLTRVQAARTAPMLSLPLAPHRRIGNSLLAISAMKATSGLICSGRLARTGRLTGHHPAQAQLQGANLYRSNHVRSPSLHFGVGADGHGCRRGSPRHRSRPGGSRSWQFRARWR